MYTISNFYRWKSSSTNIVKDETGRAFPVANVLTTCKHEEPGVAGASSL